MSFASGDGGREPHTCARPGCNSVCTSDWLYCSERCYNDDNDPNPVTLLAETDPKYVARKWAQENEQPPVRRITRSSKGHDCE